MKRKQEFPSSFSSFIEVVQYFNSEDKAMRYLQHRRWNGKPVCPHCDHDKSYAFSDGKRFKCKSCLKQYTATVGTIYQNTKVPLSKWFICIYLVINHKKGISSHQVARDINVTQKTAWFMLHRIRHLLGIENDQSEPLDGVVSADETFVGGKNKNRHKDKKIKYVREAKGREFSDKTPIVGFAQWGGKVRTVVTKDVKTQTLLAVVRKNVQYKSILVTDEWRSYRLMKDIYDHQVVQHGYGRYMNDCGFTTNNIEGFWTWIKRMIIGVYHYVSRKYLQLYAHEATFRYNTRTLSDWARIEYVLASNNGYLNYASLTVKI